MIRFLLEKEFKMIRRNPIMPKLILFMPVMMMLVLPFAANMEMKNINLSVVDHDHSPQSARLIEKINSSGYFNIVDMEESYEEAMGSIENGKSDLILEIPQNFERDLQRGSTRILIAANAVNAVKGSMGSSYLSAISQTFAKESLLQNGASLLPKVPVINPVTLNRFNLYMNYRVFMVPALMVMLITIMCGFYPALNIVGEKENGTIEQMNVTPIGKFTFIASKLIPYWIIGFVVLTLCFVLAWLVHDLTPVGNLGAIYAGAALFILVMSGFGLLISNYSQTMQQAMFVMFFFVLILILLSGLFTPIDSMPQWAQNITVFNPLKYFIQIMRGVYLKGSELQDIIPQLLALSGFALFFDLWAVLSYRKSSK